MTRLWTRGLTALLLLVLLFPAAGSAQPDETIAPDASLEPASPDPQRAVPSRPRDWRRVNVRLTGGLRQMRGGDVNDGVSNWSQAFESLLRNEVVGLQPGVGGDAAATRRGTEFGADVIVRLSRRIAIVGGVGSIESSSAGLIENAVVYGNYQSATRNSTALRLRAIPLRLGVQYTHPLGRRVRLGMEGGAGVYFTHLSWSHHLDVRGRTSDWMSETRGLGLGFHGGVWVDVGLSDRLGLVFGVEGVRANIAGFRGFREGTFSYRSPIRDDGTLRLSETPWGARFLVVGDGSWLNDRYGPITPIREASVGLGGLRISSGLRIGL